MFFYSQGDAFNVIASLSELEAGALLLSQAGARLNPDFDRWDEYGSAIARAIATGGAIHVTVEPDGVRPDLGGWRGPLGEAPEPHRGAATAALAFFGERYGQPLDTAKVEVVGLGSKEKKK